MNNFYKQYNCRNKEELYQKVVNQDKEVTSLIEFIEYAKTNIKQKKGIRSPDIFYKEIDDFQPPKKDESLIIFTNVQNIPVYKGYVNLLDKNTQKEFLQNGLNCGASSAFMVVKDDAYFNKDHNQIKELLNSTGFNVVDALIYNTKNESYNSERDSTIKFDHKNNIGNRKEMTVIHDLKYQSEFNEFASYMTKSELIGKNIISNNNEIREQLKVGYQYEDQEIFGIVTYDEDNEIVSVKELFKGASDASLVDSRIVTKELLNDIHAKGFVMFHNHPSGVTIEGSDADHNLTNKMKKLSLNLDVELLDHYILGKEQVYSFVDDGYLKTGNKDYQTKIDKTQSKQREMDV